MGQKKNEEEDKKKASILYNYHITKWSFQASSPANNPQMHLVCFAATRSHHVLKIEDSDNAGLLMPASTEVNVCLSHIGRTVAKYMLQNFRHLAIYYFHFELSPRSLRSA